MNYLKCIEKDRFLLRIRFMSITFSEYICSIISILSGILQIFKMSNLPSNTTSIRPPNDSNKISLRYKNVPWVFIEPTIIKNMRPRKNMKSQIRCASLGPNTFDHTPSPVNVDVSKVASSQKNLPKRIELKGSNPNFNSYDNFINYSNFNTSQTTITHRNVKIDDRISDSEAARKKVPKVSLKQSKEEASLSVRSSSLLNMLSAHSLKKSGNQKPAIQRALDEEESLVTCRNKDDYIDELFVPPENSNKLPSISEDPIDVLPEDEFKQLIRDAIHVDQPQKPILKAHPFDPESEVKTRGIFLNFSAPTSPPPELAEGIITPQTEDIKKLAGMKRFNEFLKKNPKCATNLKIKKLI
ncbi:hypothetical protein TRFO_08363 [Tritrichomonas foetus]|uniref:Uncharacterized protein n=1 Tax=Tritrichomonas foetus TaxID=1144522 RepID=A0A1J4JLY8_9EUKA|nr:hypothetical protein TRFO_08363 [Tritrichomonas foetus]|eukprot:OHS99439.1 hypothetical protein TRFO_08363 [Tritrichomonas foetus]